VPALIGQRAREEQRAGATLSAATMEVLQSVLDLIAEADESVDEAMPLLANLMGVPNPDEDKSGDDTETDSSDDTASSESKSQPRLSLARMRLLEDPALRSHA
jgi:hypothetical protein